MNINERMRWCSLVRNRLYPHIEKAALISRRYGKEASSGLCVDRVSKRARSNGFVVGEKGSVRTIPCSLWSRPIIYHTHPRQADIENLMFSAADLINSYDMDEIITCVGDMLGNVKCVDVSPLRHSRPVVTKLYKALDLEKKVKRGLGKYFKEYGKELLDLNKTLFESGCSFSFNRPVGVLSRREKEVHL